VAGLALIAVWKRQARALISLYCGRGKHHFCFSLSSLCLDTLFMQRNSEVVGVQVKLF
jgi:hypothetical protein